VLYPRAVTARRTNAEAAEVTVVVVTWQAAQLLADCLQSLHAQTVPYRLIVVDNASTDGTGELVKALCPEAQVLRMPHNVGFAGGVAEATRYVDTPFIGLLNNDAAADPYWLERSLDVLASESDVVAVAARIVLWDKGTGASPLINSAGVRLVAGGRGADRGLGEPDGAAFDCPTDVFSFSGGACVLRTSAVSSIGGIAAPFFLYYEDLDLAWRLRLGGWRIRYEPAARVRHRHAASAVGDSRLFAYYNERNRLLTLVRCAPVRFYIAQFTRFALTTASLLVRRALRQHLEPVPAFQLGLRLRAFGGAVRLLPWAIVERRRVSRSMTLDRTTVLRSWMGR
jgi:GT2 family glycosyltransferase